MPKKRPNARKARRGPQANGSRPLEVELSADQRIMLVAVRRQIDRIQRELGDEQSKLDALRSQDAASQQAHATATRERQALSISRVDQERLAKADRRVREIEDRISALSGAIATQEARVSQLAAELADAEAQEAEGKAQEADAHAVALEHALGNLKPVMTEFVNACSAAGAVVPQSMGIGRSMADILRRIENDTAHCAELLRQRARALRHQPPPDVPLTPKPELTPKPRWQGRVTERFVGWTARAVARIHADAKRFQCWSKRVLAWRPAVPLMSRVTPKPVLISKPSDLSERFADWNTRTAARIHAEAKRFQSLSQRVLAWRWK